MDRAKEERASILKEFQQGLAEDIELFELLDSGKILAFIDLKKMRVWIWHGSKTTAREKSNATNLVPTLIKTTLVNEEFTPRMKLIAFKIAMSKITVINDGNETIDFKIMVGLMEGLEEKETKPTRIFEYNDRESEFKEVEQKLPLHEILDADKILLFVDSTRDRVWIWRISNITVRMRFLAGKLVPSIRDKYGSGFKIIPIDEGNETLDFKIMLGLVEESDHLEFKVNEFLTLKLEYNKTFIYIKGKKFIQCMHLFLQIPPQKANLYEEVESIDEATEIFDKFLLENRIVEGKFQKPVIDFNNTITPKQEFWGHCSNIQAWAEHEYDTKLLHSNLSFPLLKALSDAGDQLALTRFKEEIALRLEGGYFPVILYLIKENYLRYLPTDYLRDLRKRISGTLLPHIFRLFFLNIDRTINRFKYLSISILNGQS